MKTVTFSHTLGALVALALTAWVVSSARAAGPAAATASPVPAFALPPIQLGAPAMTGAGLPAGVGYGAAVGMGQNPLAGMGTRFGNAPIGTPLGNLQLQTSGNPTYGPSGINNGGNGAYGAYYNHALNGPTIGGVNGAGNVLGGQTSGRFQGFQNGAFEIGGFSHGIGVGGNYPMPTLYGTALPNYSAVVPGMNNAIYGTSTPQLFGPVNGYNPGNYNINTYGFTPTPGMGYWNGPSTSAMPPNPLLPPTAVQYGWW